MDRRSFLSLAGLGGAAAVAALSDTPARAQDGARQLLELRAYTVESEAQRDLLLGYLGDAFIPAANRAGIEPIGVFVEAEALSPVRVLLPHASAESVATLTATLLADAEFLAAGATVLDAGKDALAYARMESCLLLAFEGMPQVERPATGDGRLFQLRIYESPTVKCGQKKIEMFNTAEIAIFHKTGLTPVFFGESLVGSKMPNLTYMLGFESADEQQAAWNRFRDDPDWLALRAKPEYADDKILCGITNIVLTPAACSQI
jgi:hypothetical protein